MNDEEFEKFLIKLWDTFFGNKMERYQEKWYFKGFKKDEETWSDFMYRYSLPAAKDIWLEDIRNLHYVRANYSYERTRTNPIKMRSLKSPARVVGYQIFHSKVCKSEDGFFIRKVYFVEAHDRCNEPDGIYKIGMPREAVTIDDLFKQKYLIHELNI